MNRPGPNSGDSGRELLPCSVAASRTSPLTRGQRWAEGAAIILVFVLFGGQSPPGVNEAHYLTKARHFWSPDWCAGDLFLASQDAHFVFYWTVGWLTRFCSFATSAWIGRIAAWGLLAWSWQRLSSAVVARRWWSVATAMFWLALLEHGHMAGEWVVGGVEAKCFAYALVFLALEAVLGGNWRRMWWLLGAATAMHVLVGGWSFIAAGIAWCSCGKFRPAWREQLVPALGGMGVALLGIVPALRLNAGLTPDELLNANWIYVYDRLPHHLVFHRLPHLFIARHIALVVAWLVIAALTPCRIAAGQLGERPLRGFVGGAIVLAITGALIDQLLLNHLDLAAGMLRYYWFRLSDSMVPLGVSLGLAAATARWSLVRPQWSLAVVAVMASIGAINLIDSARRHGIAGPHGADPMFQLLANSGRLDASRLETRTREWQRLCSWVRASTPTDALFITPRHQQTFKWFAERAEVATVKDVPQDARSVLAWQRRRAELAYAIPSIDSEFSPDLPYLQGLAAQWDCDWWVVDTELESRPKPWQRVFPAEGEPACLFEVYRISRKP